jgi:ankyrin repeat protein
LVPLNYAVVSGNYELFVLLCEYGADLNSRNRNIGWSPFQRAIWYGHLPIVKELCRRGVDINTFDHVGGQTGLAMARELGRKDIVEFLLSMVS